MAGVSNTKWKVGDDYGDGGVTVIAEDCRNNFLPLANGGMSECDAVIIVTDDPGYDVFVAAVWGRHCAEDIVNAHNANVQ